MGGARRKAETMTGRDKRPADPAQRRLDEMLDEALDDTFPASDPPAITEPAPTPPEDGVEDAKNQTEKPR
jgi:hypothetical protein